MEDVKDVAEEVNANSSTEDIVKASQAQEAETAESSTENEQVSETTETTEKVVKTPEGEDIDAGIVEGQSVPYVRFKEINEARKVSIEENNTLRGENEQLQEAQSQFDKALQDPDVLQVLQKKGYIEGGEKPENNQTDTKAKLKELVKDLDLSTTDGWLEAQARIADYTSKQNLSPIQKNISERENQERIQAFGKKLESDKVEAEKLCKDVYGIEYGNEADAKDVTTGAGKIMAYFDKYPEKLKLASQGLLTKSDILRLAIAEEGVKLGEKKGEKNEKDRQSKLKKTAMEGEQTEQTSDTPQADWTTEQIIAWRQKHPDAKL